MCMLLCGVHVLYVNICCVYQNRHSPLLMCGKCACRVCWSSLCDGMCVTDTCPLLLQYEWTLLHGAAVGGSMGLIEWLMANHKFTMEAKTKVLLWPHMLPFRRANTVQCSDCTVCINYYF